MVDSQSLRWRIVISLSPRSIHCARASEASTRGARRLRNLQAIPFELLGRTAAADACEAKIAKREGGLARYGDVDGVVTVTELVALGVGDVELLDLCFLVRFVVGCCVELVAGTTVVPGVLGPVICDEMPQITKPISKTIRTPMLSSTSGLRYHGDRADGRVIDAS